jgi:restriction endonuclease S subunit
LCSGDIYVLQPKNTDLLLELLPFICQTNDFFQYAVGTSAGSLSPRTNWNSLASYKFALPPLEEQRRIAKVLSAATNLAHRHKEAAGITDRISESLLFQFLRGAHLGGVVHDERFGHYSLSLPLTPVGDLLVGTQYGLSEPSISGGKYPMLRMMDLADGLATGEDLCFVDLSDEDFVRYRLKDGDVLFNRTNSHDLVGRTGVYRLGGDHVFASYLVRLKTNAEALLPHYLCAFLNAPLGHRQVMRFATRGVSQTNVNVSNLRNVLIPLPSIDYQQEVVEHLENLRRARRAHQRRGLDAQKVVARIANDFLGAAR